LVFDGTVLTAVETDVSRMDSLQGVEFYAGVLIPCVSDGKPWPGALPCGLTYAGTSLEDFATRKTLREDPIPGVTNWCDDLPVGETCGIALIDAIDQEHHTLTLASTLRRLI
jgi:hypothetical protein